MKYNNLVNWTTFNAEFDKISQIAIFNRFMPPNLKLRRGTLENYRAKEKTGTSYHVM